MLDCVCVRACVRAWARARVCVRDPEGTYKENFQNLQSGSKTS